METFGNGAATRGVLTQAAARLTPTARAPLLRGLFEVAPGTKATMCCAVRHEGDITLTSEAIISDSDAPNNIAPLFVSHNTELRRPLNHLCESVLF